MPRTSHLYLPPRRCQFDMRSFIAGIFSKIEHRLSKLYISLSINIPQCGVALNVTLHNNVVTWMYYLRLLLWSIILWRLPSFETLRSKVQKQQIIQLVFGSASLNINVRVESIYISIEHIQNVHLQKECPTIASHNMYLIFIISMYIFHIETTRTFPSIHNK